MLFIFIQTITEGFPVCLDRISCTCSGNGESSICLKWVNNGKDECGIPAKKKYGCVDIH